MKSTDNYFRFFTTLLFANSGTIIKLTSSFIILTVVALFFMSPTYTLNGSIIVKSKKIQDAIERMQSNTAARTILPPGSEDVLLEMRIVGSVELIEKAIRSLGIESITPDPGLLKKILHPVVTTIKKIINNLPFVTHTELPYAYTPEQKLALEIKEKNMITTIFPGSNIIDISLSYPDPVKGKMLLDQILTLYSTYRLELFSEVSTLNFFKDQIKNYRFKSDSIDTEVMRLTQQYYISDPQREMQGMMERINQFTLDISKDENALQALENEIDYLKNLSIKYKNFNLQDNTTLPPPVGFLESSTTPQGQYKILMDFYNELRKYPYSSLAGKELIKKIINETDNLVLLQTELLRTTQLAVKEKKNRLNVLRSKSLNIKNLEIDLFRLQIDRQLYTKNYESFSAKLEEANLEQNSDLSQLTAVQVLSRPAIPEDPTFPKIPLVVLLSIFAGLFISISMIIIKELLDNTIRYPSQIEDNLGISLIGSVVEPNSGNHS